MARRRKSEPAAKSRFPMRRIPTPESAPAHARGAVRVREGVLPEEFQLFQQRRNEILALVDAEVERYVNETAALPGEDSFPDPSLLSGEFYIGGETYAKHVGPVWYQIGIKARCLGRSPLGMDDYLGLDVWIRYDPGEDRFWIYRNTDSSAL